MTHVRSTPRAVLAGAAGLLLLVAAGSRAAEPVAGAATAVGPYVVGADDVLTVAILPGTGAEPTVVDLQVAGDGTISVVFLGPVTVKGQTTPAIGSSIQRLLASRGVFPKAQVSVNVKEHRSQGVNVTGLVHAQQRIFLRGPTRLLDVISLAGGINELEAGDAIHVMRRGAEAPIIVSRADLLGTDLARAAAANINVQADDTVHVPKAPRFCIVGAVKNASCYAVASGMTLLQALSLAGGIDEEQANRARVTIRRTLDGNPAEIRVNLDEVEGGAPAPLILADDQVLVASMQKTRFCINGPVMKQDCYDFEGGLTLEEAISKAAGLDPLRADRANVLVRRVVGGLAKDHRLDLDRQGTDGLRFPIEGGDQITVGETKHQVTVDGEVRQSGTYDLTPGMTLRDAIAKAGGTNTEQFMGALSRVTLTRGSQVSVHDVKAIMRGKAKDVPLESGDRVFVPARRW